MHGATPIRCFFLEPVAILFDSNCERRVQPSRERLPDVLLFRLIRKNKGFQRTEKKVLRHRLPVFGILKGLELGEGCHLHNARKLPTYMVKRYYEDETLPLNTDRYLYEIVIFREVDELPSLIGGLDNL